jgi:cytochrome o ubiquinol oxidase subunit 2
MNKRKTLVALYAIAVFMFLSLLMLLVMYVHGDKFAVMDPKGWVAWRESQILVASMWMMLIVVLPVFVLTLIVIWRYRADNERAKYDPTVEDSKTAEALWWGIPTVLIIVFSVLTWVRSVELDPFRPLKSPVKPMTVQVVALQWKWLFIYPEQKLATVNYLQIPENTPIDFEITADAPMNAFWIPQLGGMIYAMPAMRTELHLIAQEVGKYFGCSANLSGSGFSEMHFMTNATSKEDFDQWVTESKKSTQTLTAEVYDKLAQPSEREPIATYVLGAEGLFNQILMKYMEPAHVR